MSSCIAHARMHTHKHTFASFASMIATNLQRNATATKSNSGSAHTCLRDPLQQLTADPDPTLAAKGITQLCIAIRNVTSRLDLHPDHLREPDTPSLAALYAFLNSDFINHSADYQCPAACL